MKYLFLNKIKIFFFFLRFLDQLGWMFTFVKDDVVNKLNILQRFLDQDFNNSFSNFDTLQNAIEFETKNKLISSNPENFTRTLLRLHRALLFLIEFLRGLNERPQSETTTHLANSCYDTTLAKYR